MTIEEAITRKKQEIKVLSDQLEAAKAFIEDKVAQLKQVEADLVMLNAVVAMLQEEVPA